VEFLIRYFLRTNPLAALGYARLGLSLWLRGRVPLLAEEPRNKQEIETIFRTSLAMDAAMSASKKLAAGAISHDPGRGSMAGSTHVTVKEARA